MTSSITIFANKQNKLSFNVEVAGVEQADIQPRLSLVYDHFVISFPLNHDRETLWTANVEHGFQEIGPGNVRGKIEIICSGHFLESDEFNVDIKGDVKIEHHLQPTEAPTNDTSSDRQPLSTNFKIHAPQVDDQSIEPAMMAVPEKHKQRTDEQDVNKDAAVRDLLQSMGIATKRSKFKHKALRDYISD